MDIFEFTLANWGGIITFIGIVVAYFGGLTVARTRIKQKVSELADLFIELENAIRDDNITAEEAIAILNKIRAVIGIANYDQILSTLKITREPRQSI